MTVTEVRTFWIALALLVAAALAGAERGKMMTPGPQKPDVREEIGDPQPVATGDFVSARR